MPRFTALLSQSPPRASTITLAGFALQAASRRPRGGGGRGHAVRCPAECGAPHDRRGSLLIVRCGVSLRTARRNVEQLDHALQPDRLTCVEFPPVKRARMQTARWTMANVAWFLRVTEKTIFPLGQGGSIPVFEVGWVWRFQERSDPALVRAPSPTE